VGPDTEHVHASAANRAAYDAVSDRDYIEGAPHIRHPSVRRIYEQVASACLGQQAGGPGRTTVLELGAGSGLASWPWLRPEVELTAVDGSSEMLARLEARCRERSVRVHMVVEDLVAYATRCSGRFAVVTLVSVLHHVPEYLDLVGRSADLVAPGGWLITFQDPIRYDTVPRLHRLAERASYFAWRLGRGNYRRGIRTRWRRLRGVYSPDEPADFEEYHVVRRGVDGDAVRDLLAPRFEEVRLVEYWSTYSPRLQRLGERLGLRSTFGVVARRRNLV